MGPGPGFDYTHVRTIVADCVGLFFLEKKRKRNIVWEFAKMFETKVRV